MSACRNAARRDGTPGGGSDAPSRALGLRALPRGTRAEGGGGGGEPRGLKGRGRGGDPQGWRSEAERPFPPSHRPEPFPRISPRERPIPAFGPASSPLASPLASLVLLPRSASPPRPVSSLPAPSAPSPPPLPPPSSRLQISPAARFPHACSSLPTVHSPGFHRVPHSSTAHRPLSRLTSTSPSRLYHHLPRTTPAAPRPPPRYPAPSPRPARLLSPRRVAACRAASCAGTGRPRSRASAAKVGVDRSQLPRGSRPRGLAPSQSMRAWKRL